MTNEELVILGSHYSLDRLNRRARLIVNIGKYTQQIGRHKHRPCDDDHLHRLKTFFVYRGTAEKALLVTNREPTPKGIGIIFPVENKIYADQLQALLERGWIVLDETALYVVTSNHKGISVQDENRNKRYTAGMSNLEPTEEQGEASEEIELTNIVTEDEVD